MNEELKKLYAVLLAGAPNGPVPEAPHDYSTLVRGVTEADFIKKYSDRAELNNFLQDVNEKYPNFYGYGKSTPQQVLTHFAPVADASAQIRASADAKAQADINKKEEALKQKTVSGMGFGMAGLGPGMSLPTTALGEKLADNEKQKLHSEYRMDEVKATTKLGQLTPEEVYSITNAEELHNANKNAAIISKDFYEKYPDGQINPFEISYGHKTAAGNLSYEQIMHAKSIPGIDQEGLLLTKRTISQQKILVAEQKRKALNQYDQWAEEVYAKTVTPEIQEALNTVNETIDKQNKKEKLTPEEQRKATIAGDMLDKLPDDTKKAIYNVAKASMQSKQKRALIDQDYPELGIVEALNNDIQTSKDVSDQAMFAGANASGFNAQAAVALLKVIKGGVEVIPRGMESLASTYNVLGSVLGSNSAKAELVRRGNREVLPGTYRDSSKEMRPPVESTAIMQDKDSNQTYEIGYDRDGQVTNIYNASGYQARLTDTKYQSILNQAKDMKLAGQAKSRLNGSAMYNATVDGASDLAVTMLLAKGLGSFGNVGKVGKFLASEGPIAERVRESLPIFFQYTGRMTEQGIQQGLSVEAAATYGLMGSFAEALTEAAHPFIGKMTGGKGMALRETLARIIANPAELKALTRKTFMDIAVRGTIGEAAEEGYADVLQPIYTAAVNKLFGSEMDERQVPWQQYASDMALGGLISIGPGLIGGITNSRKVGTDAFLRESIANAVYQADKVGAIGAKFKDPKYTRITDIIQETHARTTDIIEDKSIKPRTKVDLIAKKFDEVKREFDLQDAKGTSSEQLVADDLAQRKKDFEDAAAAARMPPTDDRPVHERITVPNSGIIPKPQWTNLRPGDAVLVNKPQVTPDGIKSTDELESVTVEYVDPAGEFVTLSNKTRVYAEGGVEGVHLHLPEQTDEAPVYTPDGGASTNSTDQTGRELQAKREDIERRRKEAMAPFNKKENVGNFGDGKGDFVVTVQGNVYANEINAKHDAELAALDTLAAAADVSPAAELETKLADIERERQEALDKLPLVKNEQGHTVLEGGSVVNFRADIKSREAITEALNKRDPELWRKINSEEGTKYKSNEDVASDYNQYKDNAQQSGKEKSIVSQVKAALETPAKTKESTADNSQTDANWDMRGEGDALSGKEGSLGYTQRMLPEWNRANQLGEVNPDSPIHYESKGDVVTAYDENNVPIGVAKISTLNGEGKNGVEHIAVAPEFRRKGIATELLKRLKADHPSLDVSKTAKRSKDFVALINPNKDVNSQSKTTENAAGNETATPAVEHGGTPEGDVKSQGESAVPKTDAGNGDQVKAGDEVTPVTPAAEVTPEVAPEAGKPKPVRKPRNPTIYTRANGTIIPFSEIRAHEQQTGKKFNKDSIRAAFKLGPKSAQTVLDNYNAQKAKLSKKQITAIDKLNENEQSPTAQAEQVRKEESPAGNKKGARPIKSRPKTFTEKVKAALKLTVGFDARAMAMQYLLENTVSPLVFQALYGGKKVGGRNAVESEIRARLAKNNLPSGKAQSYLDINKAKVLDFEHKGGPKSLDALGEAVWESFGSPDEMTNADFASAVGEVINEFTDRAQIAEALLDEHGAEDLADPQEQAIIDQLQSQHAAGTALSFVETISDRELDKLLDDEYAFQNSPEYQELLQAEQANQDNADVQQPADFGQNEKKAPTEPVKPVAKEVVLPETLRKQLQDTLMKVFGLDKVRAMVAARVIDRLFQTMAKRSGIPVQAIYDSIDFVKGMKVDAVKLGMNAGLSKEDAETIAAATWVRDGRKIVAAFVNPNITSPLHEIAHIYESYLSQKERAQVMKDFGAKEWTEGTSEFFARGFEKYLAEGVAPSPELAEIFKKLKQFFMDIYKTINHPDINMKITPEMRQIYARALGVETGPLEGPAGQDSGVKGSELNTPEDVGNWLFGDGTLFQRPGSNDNPQLKSKQLSIFDVQHEKETEVEITPGNKEDVRFTSSVDGHYPITGDVQPEGSTAPSPYNIRTVSEGWIESKHLEFTGNVKVKGPADVAYIMRGLEDKSVEHFYVVHVDAKGNTHIQYLSTGITAATIVDPKQILAGVQRFGSEKIYLVHNHPSGKVNPSREDVNLTIKVTNGLRGLNVSLEHVIMDTYNQTYAVFNGGSTIHEEFKRAEAVSEKEIQYKAEAFHGVKFLSAPVGKITQANDVAGFVYGLRFSVLPKAGMLILNQRNEIIGNYVFSDGFDQRTLLKEVSSYPTQQSIILYGNTPLSQKPWQVFDNLANLDIKILDYVNVKGGGSDVAGAYESAGEEGVMNDVQEKYGTNKLQPKKESNQTGEEQQAPLFQRPSKRTEASGDLFQPSAHQGDLFSLANNTPPTLVQAKASSEALARQKAFDQGLIDADGNKLIPKGYVAYEEATRLTSNTKFENLPQGYDEGSMEARSRMTRDQEKIPPTFTKHPIGTRAVDKYGEVHELREIPIADLVVVEDGGKTEPTVNKYAEWAKQGNELPPARGVENFVAYGGKVKITDGRHRIAAAEKLGRKTVSVWVALTDPNNITRPVKIEDDIKGNQPKATGGNQTVLFQRPSGKKAAPSPTLDIDKTNAHLKAQGISGNILTPKEVAVLEKDIKNNYVTKGDEVIDPKKDDIRANIFNYHEPLLQKNINGVDVRVAHGLVREGKKTYLLYAKGKIVGEFPSKADAKKTVDFIEKSLAKNSSVPNVIQPDPNTAGFHTRTGAPIGFDYDTDQVARERFDFSNLKRLSAGSDRVVFDLGDGKVLKVAKTARGLEQNIYEGDGLLASDGLIPNVFETGLNYVVAENVPDISFTDAVPTYNYDTGEVTGEVTAREMFQDLKSITQGQFDKHASYAQDILNKYGFGVIMGYDVIFGDFSAPRNWGYRDGKPMHTDGGTFGGVQLLDKYKGIPDMQDKDFREIYKQSQDIKKQFGDTDPYTMFQRPTNSKETILGKLREKADEIAKKGMTAEQIYASNKANLDAAGVTVDDINAVLMAAIRPEREPPIEEVKKVKDTPAAHDIMTYDMTTSDEAKKMQSGATFQDVFGEKPEGDQLYFVSKLQDMLQDGLNMISIAAKAWGSEVLAYGPPLMDLIKNMSDDASIKKAVILATFLGELQQAKILQPKKAAEIQRFENQVMAYYQHYMNIQGKRVAAGRLLRIYRDHFLSEVYEDMILEEKDLKARKAAERALATPVKDTGEGRPTITDSEKKARDDAASDTADKAKKQQAKKRKSSSSAAQTKAATIAKEILSKSGLSDMKAFMSSLRDDSKKTNCP